MITNTKTQTLNSLDELFHSVDDEKKKAILLVEIAKTGNKLSDEEMGQIAHAIYMSTFVKTLNLRYNDSDKSGNTACLRPDTQIVEEVDTYQLPKTHPDTRSITLRLGNPAFWCAKEHFINTSAYNPVQRLSFLYFG